MWNERLHGPMKSRRIGHTVEQAIEIEALVPGGKHYVPRLAFITVTVLGWPMKGHGFLVYGIHGDPSYPAIGQDELRRSLPMGTIIS